MFSCSLCVLIIILIVKQVNIILYPLRFYSCSCLFSTYVYMCNYWTGLHAGLGLFPAFHGQCYTRKAGNGELRMRLYFIIFHPYICRI